MNKEFDEKNKMKRITDGIRPLSKDEMALRHRMAASGMQSQEIRPVPGTEDLCSMNVERWKQSSPKEDDDVLRAARGIVTAAVICLFVLAGLILTTCVHADNSVPTMPSVKYRCYKMNPGTLHGWNELDYSDKLRVDTLTRDGKAEQREEPMRLCFRRDGTHVTKIGEEEVMSDMYWRMK